jgi:hypothetical protein
MKSEQAAFPVGALPSLPGAQSTETVVEALRALSAFELA